MTASSGYGSAKLESGYLSFKDYQSFISAMKNIYSLKPVERENEEKSLGFVSMKTIYSNFNKELDALEKLSKEEYFKGYDLLKEKYKKEITFTDNSYTLNCSGLAESYLANSDGIVKVGDDFLYFSLNSIRTYNNKSYSQVLFETKNKNISNELISLKAINQTGSPREKISYLDGSMAGSNSFTVKASPFKFIEGNSGRAQLYARAKIYNINNSSFGNRGFVTYECNARHKNIFGTFREVKYIAGAYGQIRITLLQMVEPTHIFGDDVRHPYYPQIQADIATAPNSVDEGTKEFVVAASNVLISNHGALSQSLNTVQFNDGIFGVNDDAIQPDGYWYYIESNGSIPILQTASAIKAQILGGAPFSYPSVDFDPLDMAY
jgi:hypothetical protein